MQITCMQKKVSKDVEVTHLVKNHDLYLKIYTFR